MRALLSDLKSQTVIQKISIHWLLKVVTLQFRLAHPKTLLQQVCKISQASHQTNLNNYFLEFAPSSVIMPKIIKQSQHITKFFRLYFWQSLTFLHLPEADCHCL